MVDDQLTACIGSGLLTGFLVIFHLCNGDCSDMEFLDFFVFRRLVLRCCCKDSNRGFAGVALSCTVRDAVSNWICCGDHLQTFPYGSGVTFTVGSERRVVFLSNCMLPDFRCSAGGVVDSVFRRVRSAAITSCHAVSLAVVVVCCGKLLSAYRHGAIMGPNWLQIQLWSR
ncbi:uncharacterized protein LOC116920371 [Daphnia magna]|uniref:uncharacterized protein LOC116920371 n=1 Tax=Daphnia magna TaxID=35525 RepID=UPI001E1BDEB3|nr:uncharacterized protein LOC116920371 [Daphnia magna]